MSSIHRINSAIQILKKVGIGGHNSTYVSSKWCKRWLSTSVKCRTSSFVPLSVWALALS